jgi:hypothetical protein
MTKVSRWLVILLGATITRYPAHAFFDDFLGDHLNDNWVYGSHAEFHVADSNFTVTKVTPFNGEGWTADFYSTTGYGFDYYYEDFSARVNVTFTPGSQVFLFTLGTYSNGYGAIQLQLWGYPDVRYLSFGVGGGTDATLSLEPGGTHELRIDRVDGVLSAFLDGDLFVTHSGQVFGYQDKVTLSYAGAFENAPFNVDYVSVEAVPEPPAVFSLGVLLPLLWVLRPITRR